jgi:hypothetical protein
VASEQVVFLQNEVAADAEPAVAATAPKAAVNASST